MLSMSEHLEAPIVIIGAGRSGTYLLERMLNAHPDILMYGETAFLLPRLWRELWENSPQIGLNCNRLGRDVYRGPQIMSAREGRERRQTISKEIEERERLRLCRLAAAALVEALGVPPDCGRWGYREIWNGSPSFQYEWSVYDLAFPRAYWVHIVRHPFEFAASCAAWNEDPFTPDYLEQRLRDWVAMVARNRERRQLGRYYECRYEDLVARPSGVLGPLLRRLGLSWDERCAGALERHPHRSAQRPALPQGELATIPCLAETMEGLGYELPEMYR